MNFDDDGYFFLFNFFFREERQVQFCRWILVVVAVDVASCASGDKSTWAETARKGGRDP